MLRYKVLARATLWLSLVMYLQLEYHAFPWRHEQETSVELQLFVVHIRRPIISHLFLLLSNFLIIIVRVLISLVYPLPYLMSRSPVIFNFTAETS